MTEKHLRQKSFSDEIIHCLTTLRTPNAPENGSLALHVCENPKDVLAARAMLEGDTLPLSQWVLAWQKHTNHVARVSAADWGKGAFESETSIMETDGLYTTEPNTLIGVFTADCQGILFYDKTVPVIAAVHSGWKGTVSTIVLSLINALKKDGLFHPETLKVRFSPSLMTDSFEVGPEVVEQFETMARQVGISLEGLIYKGKGDRSFIDHQQVNVRLLEKAGVPTENITISTCDTKTNLDCFSYRRDGRSCGEHFTCIWMDEKKPEISPESHCQKEKEFEQ